KAVQHSDSKKHEKSTAKLVLSKEPKAKKDFKAFDPTSAVVILVALTMVLIAAYMVNGSFQDLSTMFGEQITDPSENQNPTAGNIEPNGTATAELQGNSAVNIELFVMSYCPFGTQAEQAILIEMVKEMPDLEYNINFIAGSNGNGTFSSLHGQPEVDENIRQLCIINKSPEKLLDYLACANTDYQNIGNLFIECADQAGIDAFSIDECAKSDVGIQLLEENLLKAQELNITSSPTWLINNTVFLQGYDVNTIQRNVCLENPDLSGCDVEFETPATTIPIGGSC
ncbi:MAG: hypothetical protein KAS30_03215, partial [Candidatus Diapherotrites archaeon]|nr:hypothetical protein [Candidatus Diapherotrites archaeon]